MLRDLGKIDCEDFTEAMKFRPLEIQPLVRYLSRLINPILACVSSQMLLIEVYEVSVVSYVDL